MDYPQDVCVILSLVLGSYPNPAEIKGLNPKDRPVENGYGFLQVKGHLQTHAH